MGGKTEDGKGMGKREGGKMNWMVKRRNGRVGMDGLIDWLSMVWRPHQHNIGYTADGFLQVKRHTNSIIVLKEKATKESNPKTQRKHKIHICIDTQNSIQMKDTRINTASPLVYNNTGWQGDSSHRGQGCLAWTAVGCRHGTPNDRRERRGREVKGWEGSGLCSGSFELF